MGDMAIEPAVRTFTVEEYHLMLEAGILSRRERVELLDGLIVTMSPIGMPHWLSEARIVKYLILTLGERAIVAPGISIPLGESSEPEPDVAVLANLNYLRRNRTPEPSEIYAMIELAESSLAKDTGPKRRLYARFEIADYLVVDLNADVLLHFSAPAGGDYPEPRRLGRGETFRLAALPDVALVVEAFLEAQ